MSHYRYFIQLAYKGSRFNGWQIQPAQHTVQEWLNVNFSKVLQQDVMVIGAGRTDTGVHASYFVAHVDVNQPITNCEVLAHKLNRMLGSDVYIYSISPVATNVHARFDAISRKYVYYLNQERNPFRHEFEHVFHFPLDFDAMNRAAKILFEYTDFTSFSKLHTQVKTNDCEIMEAQWIVRDAGAEFHIRADRFLRNMVRSIVGTLLDVGRQKMNDNDFRAIIEAKNRSKAGVSISAKGLFLTDIVYPEGILQKAKVLQVF